MNAEKHHEDAYAEWAERADVQLSVALHPSRDEESRMRLLATNYAGSYGPETTLYVHPDNLPTHQRVVAELEARGLSLRDPGRGRAPGAGTCSRRRRCTRCSRSSGGS